MQSRLKTAMVKKQQQHGAKQGAIFAKARKAAAAMAKAKAAADRAKAKGKAKAVFPVKKGKITLVPSSKAPATNSKAPAQATSSKAPAHAPSPAPVTCFGHQNIKKFALKAVGRAKKTTRQADIILLDPYDMFFGILLLGLDLLL